MQPRSEPLLWLQCLALGAIPLELLLIRLVLAGADPGPVPGVERVLIWGVGVLGPAVALWRRPADWGSLVLVRQPLTSRSNDQLRISASQNGLSGRVAVVMAALILLPVLWWLDDSAVLASELSLVSGQSRLVTLLLVCPLLALIVWQLQQLVQAATLLFGSAVRVAPADSAFRADAVATQRTSLGLQLLNLPRLEWPEAAVPAVTEPAVTEPAVSEPAADQSTEESVEGPVAGEAEEPDQGEAAADVDASASDDDDQKEGETDHNPPNNEGPNNEGPKDDMGSEDPSGPEMEDSTDQNDTDINLSMSGPSDHPEPAEAEELELDDETQANSTDVAANVDSSEDKDAEGEGADERGEGEADAEDEDVNPAAPLESFAATAASLPVEPEQPGEEEESSALDPDIGQGETAAGGSTEGHGEQAEPGGRKKSEPEQSPETPPGSL